VINYQLLAAVRDGEFDPQDFDDRSVQEAFRDGLLEHERGRPVLTAQGESELRDDSFDGHDRTEDV